MNQNELKEKYYDLYKFMANSKDPRNMKAFGNVMNEMMEWMVANKPDAASTWIERLSSIKWKNYLTPKEAEMIVSRMEPKAPWNRDQWRDAMNKYGYPLEEEPYYNRCSLWVVMNMIMSDSSQTIEKYVDMDTLFSLVHDLAVDKLKDKDEKFEIKSYFNVVS